VTGTTFSFPKAFFSTLQSGKMSHSRGWDIFHSWEGKGKKPPPSLALVENEWKNPCWGSEEISLCLSLSL